MVLTPYSTVRYISQDAPAPHNREELFNLRHAILRSAIDCTFRLRRRKFKVIRKPEFPDFEKQVLLIYALAVMELHTLS